MRIRTLMGLIVLVLVFAAFAGPASAAEPTVYQWWVATFGADASWADVNTWAGNYVLNGTSWRPQLYQDPDDSSGAYDLTTYMWTDGWDTKEVKLQVEYAGWASGNRFGFFDVSDADDTPADTWVAMTDYELFPGSATAGATTTFTVPDGLFGFWLDSTKKGGQNGGVWYTDPQYNNPVLDDRAEPDNRVGESVGPTGDTAPPFMQAVVMEYPSVALPSQNWTGWIIAWADWDLSQIEYHSANEADYNDMVVSIVRTPELPPSALLMLSMLPLGLTYLRGRRRRDA